MHIQPITSMKEVIISWKESSALLINKRFWLVTLKTALETYIMLFKKFWWLLILCITYDVSVRSILVTSIQNLAYSKLAVNGIWFLLWCLLGFVTFLIARPSLRKKDSSYFVGHWKEFCWFVLITAFAWVVRSSIVEYITAHTRFWFFFSLADTVLFLRTSAGISTLYFSPFLILYTFFYLDCSKKILCFLKRLWSALLMVIYTYPFCFIVWFIVSAIAFVMMQLSSFIVTILVGDSSKLLLPFFIALFNNLYTKQVHEYYERYA